jgi:SEC-C motif-containing protein
MSVKEACPCGSNKPYTQCCEPLHLFKDKARSVRQLVRARYCAYARGAGNHRDFLVRTWHPATAQQINPIDVSNDSYVWCGLDILRAEQKGDMGRVEFKALFRERDGGPLQEHHELSLFHRIKGNWLYVEGRVRDTTIEV